MADIVFKYDEMNTAVTQINLQQVLLKAIFFLQLAVGKAIAKTK